MTVGMTGKNIVVTGASRGLGWDIARALLREGANLLLASRGPIDTELLAREASASPSLIRTVRADLANADGVRHVVEAVREAWPSFDVLINNAAIQGPIGPLEQNDWAEWQKTITVDLLAVVDLCRQLTPNIRSGGSIINISGGGATAPRPGFSAYATAKAGVVRFSEVLAYELRERNIRVNCVAPGAMDTQMLRQILDAGAAAGDGELAAARKALANGEATRQRAVDLVCFLSSDASAAITGRLISAVWDPWKSLDERAAELAQTDIYTLRRIVPADRGREWVEKE